MKLLKRNTTEFEYVAYTGLESDLNEDGLHTGEYKPVYAEPVTYRGTISAPSGGVTQAFDGVEKQYTHILLMDDPNADIRETGVIRSKGKLYYITAVRPSINVLNVALRERTEDDGDQEIYIPNTPDSGDEVEP